MNICEYNKCTGCGACYSLCPQSCITMQEDDYGEVHPLVDESKCLNCGLCQRKCPCNNEIKTNQVLNVYAAWREDKKKLLDSASGGIGAVLVENWIDKMKGIVYGTVYDDDFKPIIKKVTNLSDAEKLKGSKYIQSDTGDTFKEVKNILIQGHSVMYIGTPCQIAGLYAVVDKDNPNLLTIEILCHGVSPYAYFKEELDCILEKNRITNIDNVTFRSNQWMMDFYLGLWKNGKVIYSQQAYENNYFFSFLSGLSLRNSCYACQYKKNSRVGDIMIGDFIGFGKKVPFSGPQGRKSLVIIGTSKGDLFLKQCGNAINTVERTIEEAVLEGRSLKESFPMHPKRREFLKEYKKSGFSKAVNNVVGDEIKSIIKKGLKRRIKRNIKICMNRYFHIVIKDGRITYDKENIIFWK